MRTQCHRSIGILFILLIGSAGLQPGFAKGGRGPGHVYSKSSAARPSSSAKPALRGANNTQVPVKEDTARTAVPRGIDKSRDIDTWISVQPRLPEKRVIPNGVNAKAGLAGVRNPYHPRAFHHLLLLTVRPAALLILAPRAYSILPRISPAANRRGDADDEAFSCCETGPAFNRKSTAPPDRRAVYAGDSIRSSVAATAQLAGAQCNRPSHLAARESRVAR
jgi:hypothetical protein